MHYLNRALILAVVFAARSFAQGVGNGSQGASNSNGGQGNANGKTPDQDWANVVTLATPAPSSQTPPGQQKTLAQTNVEHAQKAAVAVQAAQAAKDFYTNNPANVNAPVAKKIEAVQALLGVTDDNKAQEIAAQQTAAAYRSDSINSPSDRFDVALLSERVSARATLKGSLDTENIAGLEKIADKLHAEFGDQAEVFNFYATVARGADMADARLIAGNLTQWPSTSEAKEEARSILARDALLGKPFTVKLTGIDGRSVDLSLATGSISVLCVCSYSGVNSNPFSGLRSLKKTVPATARVVYLVAGATAEQLQAVKSSAPIAGIFCVDANDQSTSVSQQLGVRRTPFVFVVNAAGALTGFGPLGELANLLTAANK